MFAMPCHVWVVECRYESLGVGDQARPQTPNSGGFEKGFPALKPPIVSAF